MDIWTIGNVYYLCILEKVALWKLGMRNSQNFQISGNFAQANFVSRYF